MASSDSDSDELDGGWDTDEKSSRKTTHLPKEYANPNDAAVTRIPAPLPPVPESRPGFRLRSPAKMTPAPNALRSTPIPEAPDAEPVPNQGEVITIRPPMPDHEYVAQMMEQAPQSENPPATAAAPSIPRMPRVPAHFHATLATLLEEESNDAAEPRSPAEHGEEAPDTVGAAPSIETDEVLFDELDPELLLETHVPPRPLLPNPVDELDDLPVDEALRSAGFAPLENDFSMLRATAPPREIRASDRSAPVPLPRAGRANSSAPTSGPSPPLRPSFRPAFASDRNETKEMPAQEMASLRSDADETREIPLGVMAALGAADASDADETREIPVQGRTSLRPNRAPSPSDTIEMSAQSVAAFHEGRAPYPSDTIEMPAQSAAALHEGRALYPSDTIEMPAQSAAAFHEARAWERSEPATAAPVRAAASLRDGRPSDRSEPITGPPVQAASLRSGRPSDRSEPITGPPAPSTPSAREGRSSDRSEAKFGPHIQWGTSPRERRPSERVREEAQSQAVTKPPVQQRISYIPAAMTGMGDPLDDDAPRSSERPTMSGEDPTSKVGQIKNRFVLGDYSGALALAEAVLEEDAANSTAAHYATSCRDMLRQMYLSQIGEGNFVPRLVMEQDQLRWLTLDHRAGFLLSCIDGASSVDEILDVCGMPSLDALRTMSELLQQGAIVIESPPTVRR